MSGGGGGDGFGGDPGCQPIGSQSKKVDLVLAIDTSRGMADKHAILALAVADLVQAFTNPACVDAAGNPSAQQPLNHTEACPDPATSRDR